MGGQIAMLKEELAEANRIRASAEQIKSKKDENEVCGARGRGRE